MLQTVNTLCKEIEQAILSLPDHFPAVLPPGIRLRQQEIRRKAGKNQLPGRYFIAAVPLSPDGKVKSLGFSANPGIVIAMTRILPVDLTEFAARADFGTAMPGIPVCVDAALFLLHGPSPPIILRFVDMPFA